MPRALIYFGLVLAVMWIGAAGYLFARVNTDAEGPNVVSFVGEGTVETTASVLTEADAPIASIAQEQIARVTDIGVAPPRNVSPGGTTGWPTPAADAARIAGEKPASPPPEPVEPDVLHRVVVEEAGRLKSGKALVTLAHIETRSRGHKCYDDAGRRWPCGQAAVTELRMLIRGRSVACDGLKGPKALKRKQPRTCRIGQTDIAEWLVAQGWAVPKPDAPKNYREAHLAAQVEKHGIYGPAWGREPATESASDQEAAGTETSTDTGTDIEVGTVGQ